MAYGNDSIAIESRNRDETFIALNIVIGYLLSFQIIIYYLEKYPVIYPPKKSIASPTKAKTTSQIFHEMQDILSGM